MKKEISYPKKIIVRMPNWIGDFIMATPILKDVKNKFSKAKIYVICKRSLKDLLKYDKNVDGIIGFESSFSKIFISKRFIDEIKEHKFDLGILLTNSFSSAIWFFRGKVKNIVGFNKASRSIFLNHPIKFPKERNKQHLVITYKSLINSLGINESTSSPYINLNKKDIDKSYERLKEYGYSKEKILIGINPGASYGSAKCWPEENFNSLSKLLLKHKNVFIVFFGDDKSEILVNNICKDLSERLINLSNKTSILELACLIKHCDLFLTNDSGPMHIASALNVLVLALFGSTDEIITGPYNGGHVINKKVECSPCFCRECPKDFKCMKNIKTNEVYDKIKELLKGKIDA